MKKRILSLALVLLLTLSLLPATAAAADYPEPNVPDVFQGDGVYVTVKPLILPEGYKPLVESFGDPLYDGLLLVYKSETVMDSHGYPAGSRRLVNFADASGCLIFPSPYEVYESAYLPAIRFSKGVCELQTEQNHYIRVDRNGNIVDEGDTEKHTWDRNEYAEHGITLGAGALEGIVSLGSYRNRFTDKYAIARDRRGEWADARYGAPYVIIDTSGNIAGSIRAEAPLYISGVGYVSDDGYVVARIENSMDSSAGTLYRVYDIKGNVVLPEGVLKFANSDPFDADYRYDGGLINAYGADDSREPYAFFDIKGNPVVPLPRTECVNNWPYDPEVFKDSGLRPFVEATQFDNGAAFMHVYLYDAWGDGNSVASWYYMLEAHEGTYSGPGRVYNYAKGGFEGSAQPTAPTTPTQSGADKPSDWARSYVDEAVSANLVPQTLRSSYTSAITRAEFCALAAQLYEAVKGEIATRAEFSDTTDVNVQKMASLGVVTGVGDGRFDPDGFLTREQAAAMLSRLADALGKPLPAGSAAFADNASVSSWALEAVGRMQASGVMSGVGDNKFDPAGSYTREQSIITALRLYNAVK